MRLRRECKAGRRERDGWNRRSPPNQEKIEMRQLNLLESHDSSVSENGTRVSEARQQLDSGPIWVHWLPNTVQNDGATRRTNLSETTG